MATTELLHAFHEECEELLPALESGLLALEAHPDNTETLNSVFRVAHTLKSSGALLDQPELSRFAHNMETLLDALRHGELTATVPMISNLLGAKDILTAMVSRVLAGGDAGEVDVGHSLQELNQWLDKTRIGAGANVSCSADNPTRKKSSLKEYFLRIKLARGTLQSGVDPSLLFDELRQVAEVIELNADPSDLPLMSDLDPTQLYLHWSARVRTASPSEVEAVLMFALDGEGLHIEPVESPSEPDSVPQLNPLPRRSAVPEDHRRSNATVRVDSRKLDELLDLVGELILCSSQVSRAAKPGAELDEERREAAELLERLTRDLQGRVMGARMTPVGESFAKFKRLARDLSRSLGKSAELVIRGEETELDKNLIDLLTDPLKHMIRNCVDHGIEPPEERQAAGKPPTGTVTLEAEQREDYVLVTVADDGRGISPDKVLTRARQLGIVREGEILGNEELFDLLFRPGFSTADKVSEVSGRGVGLDVVKSNVEQLRGRIELDSREGKGTVFRLRLPLTLAIVDGMMAQIGAETVTFPVASVVELVRPTEHEVTRVDGGHELLFVRKEFIPILRLHEHFGFWTDRRSATEGTVVVLQSADQRFGVLVDRITGLRQAVIKPLNQYFALAGRIPGISGATVLADGSVSIMVDVSGLQRCLDQNHRSSRVGLSGGEWTDRKAQN